MPTTVSAYCGTAVGGGWSSSGDGIAYNIGSSAGSINQFFYSTNIFRSISLTNFGFSLPSNAIVDDIVFHVYSQASVASVVRFYYAQCRTGGSTVGTRYTENLPYQSGSWRFYDFDHDTWGKTWTAAEVNHSDFGLELQLTDIFSGGGTSYVQFDYATCDITYRTESSVIVDQVGVSAIFQKPAWWWHVRN